MRLLSLVLCMMSFALVAAGFQQAARQDSLFGPDGPVYVQTRGEEDILSVILAYLGEPSFLRGAEDASLHAYRSTYFSSVPVKQLVVRLVVKTDGSGEITSAVSSSSKSEEFVRTKNAISAKDVEVFLQLVEKDSFWIMPSTEKRKLTLDGSCEMVEGVRNGSFHYVFRRSPEPGSFTEIESYMLKNLAKIDDSVIKIPEHISPRK